MMEAALCSVISFSTNKLRDVLRTGYCATSSPASDIEIIDTHGTTDVMLLEFFDSIKCHSGYLHGQAVFAPIKDSLELGGTDVLIDLSRLTILLTQYPASSTRSSLKSHWRSSRISG